MTDHLDDDPNCDAAYDGEQCELALGHTGDHMSHNDDWPATVRDAARQAAGQPAAEPVVAYLDDFPRVTLYCREHGEDRPKLVPRTADDLPFGGVCTTCGRDVLILAGQPDPTTADDPTRLRWGLGDVLHSDDGTLIVCLSGPAPDRAPYWLELDQERAAALRDELLHEGKDIVAEACRRVDIDDTPVLVRGAGAWTAEDQDHMAEIVRAAKRRHEAEHPAVGRQDSQPTTTEQARVEENETRYALMHLIGDYDDETTELLDAYRAAILNNAADAAHALSLDDYPASSIAARLRRLATGAES